MLILLDISKKMIFHINPMLIENFLWIERSETLPSNFTKKNFLLVNFAESVL